MARASWRLIGRPSPVPARSFVVVYGWNSVVLSNHDLGRVVSRFGDDGRHWAESAKMLMTLVLTQRATPFVYQGDEIGMTNCPFESYDDLDDVWARTTYRLKRERGDDHAAAFAAALAMTRDHARTPFQWDASPFAGFSTVKPWLPVNPNFTALNAAAQMSNPDSIHAFVKRLIALRQSDPVWIEGAFEDLAPDDPDLFVYARTHAGRTATVALNLRGVDTRATRPEAPALLSNYPAPYDPAALRPWEARVYAPT